jgi:hypothetical protein
MFRPTLRLLGAIAAFALVAPAAHAQYSPDRATALEVRKEFLTNLDSLQSRFLALAEAFPADKYAWRPAPGVRSVGEVFMHVASEYYFWTPAVFGATPSADRLRPDEQREAAVEQMTRKSPAGNQPVAGKARSPLPTEGPRKLYFMELRVCIDSHSHRG